MPFTRSQAAALTQAKRGGLFVRRLTSEEDSHQTPRARRAATALPAAHPELNAPGLTTGRRLRVGSVLAAAGAAAIVLHVLLATLASPAATGASTWRIYEQVLAHLHTRQRARPQHTATTGSSPLAAQRADLSSAAATQPAPENWQLKAEAQAAATRDNEQRLAACTYAANNVEQRLEACATSASQYADQLGVTAAEQQACNTQLQACNSAAHGAALQLRTCTSDTDELKRQQSVAAALQQQLVTCSAAQAVQERQLASVEGKATQAERQCTTAAASEEQRHAEQLMACSATVEQFEQRLATGAADKLHLERQLETCSSAAKDAALQLSAAVDEAQQCSVERAAAEHRASTSGEWLEGSRRDLQACQLQLGQAAELCALREATLPCTDSGGGGTAAAPSVSGRPDEAFRRLFALSQGLVWCSAAALILASLASLRAQCALDRLSVAQQDLAAALALAGKPAAVGPPAAEAAAAMKEAGTTGAEGAGAASIGDKPSVTGDANPCGDALVCVLSAAASGAQHLPAAAAAAAAAKVLPQPALEASPVHPAALPPLVPASLGSSPRTVSLGGGSPEPDTPLLRHVQGSKFQQQQRGLLPTSDDGAGDSATDDHSMPTDAEAASREASGSSSASLLGVAVQPGSVAARVAEVEARALERTARRSLRYPPAFQYASQLSAGTGPQACASGSSDGQEGFMGGGEESSLQDNPLYRSSTSSGRGRSSVSEAEGPPSNPLFQPRAASSADEEATAAAAAGGEEAPLERELTVQDNVLYSVAEAAAKQHMAVAVQLLVQQLQEEVEALRQQLASQSESAAAALGAAAAAAAAQERQARQQEAAAAESALVAMRAQLAATQQRLAEAEVDLAAAREEAAAALRQVAALVARLEQVEVMSAFDASLAGRQVSLLSSLLSSRSSEAEQLLRQLQQATRVAAGAAGSGARAAAAEPAGGPMRGLGTPSRDAGPSNAD